MKPKPLLSLAFTLLFITACSAAPEIEPGFDPGALKFDGEQAFAIETELVTRFTDRASGPWMTAAGFQAGLLTIFANNDPSVIQVLPPLIIQEDEARQVLSILDAMLASLEAKFQ